MLERITLEKNVNVYEFVRLMRAKRNYMVQTEVLEPFKLNWN